MDENNKLIQIEPSDIEIISSNAINPDNLNLKVIPTLQVGSLLKSEDLGLTEEEREEFDAYQSATYYLGPAAGAILQCPGNQIDSKTEDRCPYYTKCVLRRVGKAPKDKLCPVERQLVEKRFMDWCKELNTDPGDLTESDRTMISDLVWIELQIERCVNILSTGKEARLTQINIKEAILMDTDSPSIPVSTETVLHVLSQRLDQLLLQRRNILKDWMLTPEQKFKFEKLKNPKNNASELSRIIDAGLILSNKADRIKKRLGK